MSCTSCPQGAPEMQKVSRPPHTALPVRCKFPRVIASVSPIGNIMETLRKLNCCRMPHFSTKIKPCRGSLDTYWRKWTPTKNVCAIWVHVSILDTNTLLSAIRKGFKIFLHLASKEGLIQKISNWHFTLWFEPMKIFYYA